MKNFVLTVTLNPAVDEIFKVKKHRTAPGWILGEQRSCAGGKGINVARALTRLGTPVVATGLLGGITGQFIVEELRREKIKNDFVSCCDPTRTNVTILDVSRNTMNRLMEDGAPLCRPDLEKFKKKFKALLKKSSWVVLSGRIPGGTAETIYRDLLHLARRENVKTFLDSHGRAFSLGLQAKPLFIKPNSEETQHLLRQRLNSLEKLKKAIRYFLRRDIPYVFVTLGAKGALASDGRGLWLARPPQIKCVNAVGCGDAFIAGFIAAFEKPKDFLAAFRLAVAAGTANALGLQPGAIHKNIVHKIAQQVKIEALKF